MRTDVVYAKSEAGADLPVIDVTNPAFAVSATDAELAAMAEQYVIEASRQQEIPEALREALRNSLLGRGLMAGTGTFLDGMSTYLLKLGPDNLCEGATPIDQRIAASFPAFTTRLRLQDVAKLLADGLASSVASDPRRPLCFVNIGGGPASDSWNALILLRAGFSCEDRSEQEELLADREIAIAVADVDRGGPAFGARAVEALREAAAPLSGLNIVFRHFSYEWSNVGRLRQALEELRARHGVCGISSEGGLFEYGSDEEIVSNLRELNSGTAFDAIIVGSVTRDGAPVRASLASNRFLTRPRTI